MVGARVNGGSASPDDAHRQLEKSHHLAASLSHVETRQVRNNYTFPWESELYQIERQSIVAGLRLAHVRVEKRLDGSIAVCHQGRYLAVKGCAQPVPPTPAMAAKSPDKPARQRSKRGSDWNKNFDLHKAPPIWHATQSSGHRPEGAD